MAKKNVAGAGWIWIGSLACGLVYTFGKIVDALIKDTREVPGRFFMIVELGFYSDGKAIRKAIRDSGKKISDDAGKILERIDISSEKTEVDLWEVSNAELGFTKAAPRSETDKHAFEFGFKKCPSEAVALSRIKCEDGKWRIGGMEPRNGFYLLSLSGDSDDPYLGTDYDSPCSLWLPDTVWIFVRPRRK